MKITFPLVNNNNYLNLNRNNYLANNFTNTYKSPTCMAVWQCHNGNNAHSWKAWIMTPHSAKADHHQNLYTWLLMSVYSPQTCDLHKQYLFT